MSATSSYPNRNLTLERKWKADINRRFATAWSEIKRLKLPNMLTNLSMSEEQLVQFYLDQIRSSINEAIVPTSWQNKYQRIAYERAMEKAGREIVSSFPATEAAVFLAVLASEIDFAEIHRNEFNFLSDRANIALTATLNTFMVEAKGLLRDNLFLPAKELQTLLFKRFTKAKNAARRAAVTELNQAAQRAALLRALEFQDATGIDTSVRWVTVKDSRVRHLHAGWHGRIFSRERAQSNMQISPWNCRCGLRPVVKDRIPARVNARFAKERKALLASEKN